MEQAFASAEWEKQEPFREKEQVARRWKLLRKVSEKYVYSYPFLFLLS